MKFSKIIGVVLLFSGLTPAIGFEAYDYKKVPSFPNLEEDYEFKLMSLVEILTDIALIEDLPDLKRAHILAAARRISPMNRRAFYAEYQLSIGLRPTGTSPIRKEMISSALQIHFVNLEKIPGTKNYVEFLKAASDLNAVSVPVQTTVVTEPVSNNTCGLLTHNGCVSLGCLKERVSGSNFQFTVGNLKSGIFLSAYRESIKYLALKNTRNLSGVRLNFMIDAELTPEEGPAAALACAVLTEAAAKNLRIDPRVALAGDVNADGSVQPLGDQVDRLMADAGSLYKITVIPKADQGFANDILLLHGPWFFSKTQLVGVGKLSEAVDIASQKKSPGVSQALSIFAEVQKVLNGPEGRKFLTNSHVRKRLVRVLELMPDHLSARQLNRASMGNYPKTLSLVGSFEIIFKALKPAIKKGQIDQNAKLDPEALVELKRYRKRLDPTLKKLVDATFAFETSGRVGGQSSIERARVKQRLKEELNAISRNIKIRERMM